jgi:pimeloyl-ACP methyl ester carboxylesterase
MINKSEMQVPEIYFEDSGKGKTIVFLHGFLSSLEIWDYYTEKLENNFRVISIDLPGHGSSGVITDEHSMELMAEEIRNILEILGITKIVLVGHSMGGYAAMAFAEKYPQLLKGLVLLHSNSYGESEEGKINRDRLIQAVQHDHITFIKNFIPDLFAEENRSKYKKEIDKLIKISLKTPKEGVIAALKGLRNRKDRRQILKDLQVPVLFIAGKKDGRIPVDVIREQVETSDNAVMVELENVGHMGFIEARDEILEVIRDFAQSV